MAAGGMIQLSRAGLRLAATDAALAAFAAQFAARHVIQLPAFLDPGLGSLIDARLSRAAFRSRVEEGVEVEHVADDPELLAVCHFVMNDPRLLQLVERLTGCGPLTRFTGRIYRRRAATVPGEHYYPWHDDVSEDRRVAISINLGREAHGGGELQIRDAKTHAAIAGIANLGHHDAMLFRVSPSLEHRVAPVVGGVPRTVLAGWFRGGGDS